MEQIHQYTIKLIRYVLKGDIPELPKNIDFESLYEFSKSHGVENMIYVGLRDLEIEVPEPTMQKFKEAYEMAIMVEAMQAIELEQISNAFEKAGIDHIPLKGSVIKYLYPDPSYRKSGDIDILIKPEDCVKSAETLTNLGFEVEENFKMKTVHYESVKKPFVKVEMHWQLVGKSNRAYKFCSQIWENVSVESRMRHRFSINNEFLYVYLMAHLSKHLFDGGAGIRLISDIWVIRNIYNLDAGLIEKFLKKANLIEIHRMILCLIDRWFDDKYVVDADIDILENIIITGGSFGTYETYRLMKNNDKIGNKFFRFIRMVFPNARLLSGRYPMLIGKPYLLPVIWIHRIFCLVFLERGKVVKKIKDNFGTEIKEKNINNIISSVNNKSV